MVNCLLHVAAHDLAEIRLALRRFRRPVDSSRRGPGRRPGYLHCFATGFDRERLLGPRQIVTVLLTMIREPCGYERGLALLSKGEASTNSDHIETYAVAL